MAPLFEGTARTLPAKWRRYIQIPGFAHIKIEKKYFVSYDIYGFAINRIYKRTSTICISLFFGGGWSRSLRNYFSNVRTKANASDSRKKTVRNAVNRGGVRNSKKKFFKTCCLIS